MWSILNDQQQQQKKFPGWTQVDLIWVFFFCLLIVFIYVRTQHDGQMRPTSFRAAQGRDSAQEKKTEQNNSAAGSVCLPDVTALYIVFETVDYRYIVFIISHHRL